MKKLLAALLITAVVVVGYLVIISGQYYNLDSGKTITQKVLANEFGRLMDIELGTLQSMTTDAERISFLSIESMRNPATVKRTITWINKALERGEELLETEDRMTRLLDGIVDRNIPAEGSVLQTVDALRGSLRETKAVVESQINPWLELLRRSKDLYVLLREYPDYTIVAGTGGEEVLQFDDPAIQARYDEIANGIRRFHQEN